MKKRLMTLALTLISAGAMAQNSASSPPYTLFESGQVRPLAMSPDNRHLFAVNTPDNRLEIFRVKKNRLIHTASIPVGLEPVAVAARTNREVWVVNHLSDSVSVVELDDNDDDDDDDDDATTGHVKRTLLVGDEPRDIVFAGPGRRRAFITTAHRGQNIPFDPQVVVALMRKLSRALWHLARGQAFDARRLCAVG